MNAIVHSMLIAALMQAAGLPSAGVKTEKNDLQSKGGPVSFESIIPKIVGAFDINKGDVVLVQLWGENEDLPLLDRCAIEVAKRGGVPVKWQQSRKYLAQYFSSVPPEHLAFPDACFEAFKPATTVVDLLTYSPAPGPDFPKERYPQYGAYVGRLFKIVTGKKYLIQVFVPTRENAEQAGIDFNTFEATVTAALDVDYAQDQAPVRGAGRTG